MIKLILYTFLILIGLVLVTVAVFTVRQVLTRAQVEREGQVALSPHDSSPEALEALSPLFREPINRSKLEKQFNSHGRKYT